MRPTNALPKARRWLLPREHGAYGQLGFPLFCALSIGRVHWTAALLVVSVIALFIAHEPVLVLRGERGKRRLDAERVRARWQLASWMIVGVAAGATAIALSTAVVWRAAILPSAFGLAALVLLARREERTTLGEIVIALAFALTALPVAAANGADQRSAWWVAMTWGVVSSIHVLVVRGLLARGRTDGSTRYAERATGIAVLAFGVIALAAARGVIPWVMLAAVGPAVALACVFFARPPSLRKLKTVGWALMGSSLATLVVLIVSGHA